jgi:YVTN family beta-propeller protein
VGVEFRVLGPLEVRLDGVTVPLGGPRQRALLATLLLNANRVVSRDRLIGELLGDSPSESADHTLRVQVSRLRKAIDVDGGARLLSRAPGYLLRVEQDELDLYRFEALLAAGRTAAARGELERAAELLREAESLWHGRALADLEFEPFARIDIDRLEEQRLVTIEERTDLELALGRHAAVVAELEARVSEHPLRDRGRGQLMLALYRCGRQADALETYRAGRKLMSDELAIEPSRALRALEGAILRQEPDLDLPAQNGGAVLTEVGGDSELGTAPNPPAARDAEPGPPRAWNRRRNRVAVALAVALAGATALLLGVALQGSGLPSAGGNTVGEIDAKGDALISVVSVGGPPGGIATGLGAVWTTDTADNLLVELSPSGRIIERVPVGNGPQGVAVGDGDVWVVNQLDRSVSQINPRAVRQVDSFPVGTGAGPVAFGDGKLWVANTADDTVSRIDPANGTVATVALPGSPAGIAVGPDGVWVTSSSTGQLLLIDPDSDTITQAVEIGNGPAGVAAGGGAVWVADTSENTLARFDPGTGQVTPIDVGSAPLAVAYGAGALWVADSGGSVARVDPKSGSVTRIHVGSQPSALALAGNSVWTTVLPALASHRGGTLRIVAEQPFQSLGTSVDPATFAGTSQWQMLSLTSDGLVGYRRTGGLAGSELVPDLATALPTPTDGGRTYTFRLRDGIRYSNGVAVRPEDFRHELERVFMIGNGYPQQFYTGIVGAQKCLSAYNPNTQPPQRTGGRCNLDHGIIVDDARHTVTFHLVAPDPDFLYKLAFSWADAVPATTPDHDMGRTPLPGTGPYMTQSITPTHVPGPDGYPLAFHTWTLVRNPRYQEWSTDAQPDGYPNRIVLTNDMDPDEATNQVERGSVDVLLGVPVARARELEVRYTNQLHNSVAPEVSGFVLNTRVAPFDRLAARQAINYAIDRARTVTLAGGQLQARPTCQILPPTLSGYQPYCPYTLSPSTSGSWHGPDLARAQRLVAASGTRGMTITVLIQPPDVANPTVRIGSYLVSVLDQIGYHASLRSTQNVYAVSHDSRKRIQISWFTWEQDYAAPSNFFDPLFTCRSFTPDTPQNTNGAEFCDPRVDSLIQHAGELQALAPGTASGIWSQVDREITNEAPWLPLYNSLTPIATSARAGNYQYHPFWQLLLDQIWVQ